MKHIFTRRDREYKYKILVIIGDNKMVDVDLRKLIFCFLIRMSDDGVGFKHIIMRRR